MSSLSKTLAVFVKQDLSGHSSDSRKWSDHSKGALKSLFDSMVHSDHLWKTGAGGDEVAIREIEGGVSESDVSSYIPKSIRAGILRKMENSRVFQWRIGKRTVQIHIISTKLSNRVILEMIYRMYLWLSIVFRYASPHCAKKLDVFIYLSGDTKRVPVSSRGVIDREHVNTAFTTSCQPEIEIHIFREEEWFKVFIHECFHCFGLDFSGMSGASRGDRVIKGYFGLNPAFDLRIYEAYTETWAEIVHTLMHSFLYSRSRSWENVFRHFAKSLKVEQAFSAFQCCKVLAHNGLSYRDICGRSMGRYNEKSNVFSYYILKSALLYHTGDFIDWCIAHNGGGGNGGPFVFLKTDQNIQDFCGFQNIQDFCGLLIGACCQTGYLSFVSEIEGKFHSYQRSGKHRDILDTLRMTVYG
jgi:hypothetical protein